MARSIVLISLFIILLLGCGQNKKSIQTESSSIIVKPQQSVKNKNVSENEFAIIQRKVLKRTLPKNFSEEGVTFFKVCVNRMGMVVSAEIIKEKTTIRSQQVLDSHLDSMRKTTFVKDMSAPEVQCGSWKVTVKNP